MLNTRLPESVITFLSAFLNINKTDFVNPGEECLDFEEESVETDEAEVEIVNKLNYTKKMLKAQSLFQAMQYMVNNGRKKSPLPVMISPTI